MTVFILILVAYLIGSVNMSIVIAKLFGKPDPRTQGSGNAGATNTLRTSGKKDAALVLLGDILKGIIAVMLARLFKIDNFMLGLVAFSAVLGHIFPVYFKFKGGKGVATMIGVLIALNPWLGAISTAIWIVAALLSRYASLASLAAATSSIVLCLFFKHYAYVIPITAIAGLITWKHTGNIDRLRSGTESKIF